MIELITRADDEWKCWPSVERLCKVRGIKHEKNFKGADYYLPGLVTKIKKGRKNVYYINTPALEGLSEATVSIKHTAPKTDTPALEGVNTPAVADNTPAVEGANTTSNTTSDSSFVVAAGASPTLPKFEVREGFNPLNFESRNAGGFIYFLSVEGVTRSNNSTKDDTPSVEGVLEVMPDGAVGRTDRDSKYAYDGYLFKTVAAANRARDNDWAMSGGDAW